MNWDKMIDLLGSASKIGLFLCFCGAVWIEVSGAQELKPLVNKSAAVFITTLTATLAVYVWEIVRKRNRRSKEVHPPL